MNKAKTAETGKKKDESKAYGANENNFRENAEAVSRETFEKLNDKKRLRKIVFVCSLVLLITVLVTVFAMICFTVFFRVEKIYITGCDRYAEADIIGISGIEPEMSIYRISSSQVEDRITLKYPYIKEVRMILQLLHIQVEQQVHQKE